MNCKFCNNKTSVVDTVPYNHKVYRRRRCVSCDKTFYTVEVDANLDEAKEAFRYKQSKKNVK